MRREAIKTQWKPMVKLAVPVAVAQLGHMSMGLVDTFMVGRLGPAYIGGVGIGNAVFFIFAVMGIGFMLGLDFLVSHAYGRRDLKECHYWYVQSVYYGLIMA